MNPKKIPQQLLLDDWVAAQQPKPKSKLQDAMESVEVAPKTPLEAPTKQCKQCLKVLPLSEFYRESRRPHQPWGKCKHCTVKRVVDFVHKKHSTDAQWLINYAKRYRLRQRAKREQGEVPEITKEESTLRAKQMRIKHPERFRARTIFSNSIRSGMTTPQPCAICGNVKSEGHHEDYAKPLEVKWLCRKHHMARHVELNDERRRALVHGNLSHVTPAV